MGIVPENEYTIGCECAGFIKRLAPGVTKFKVGDRVACMRSGTYVNRVQCPYERVHIIPDSMSFEDAATIPLVYLTAIYSLYHLGNLREGQVRTTKSLTPIYSTKRLPVGSYPLRSRWCWNCSNPTCSVQEGRCKFHVHAMINTTEKRRLT